MRLGFISSLAISVVCLALAGCETTSEHTGSVAGMKDDTPSSTGLMGEDPKGDLELGKKYYRDNSFGLAEQHFRRAVEKGPNDLEAWVGLAASYDKLKRFDLADRAYAQAIRLAGPTPEILNNQGYSYLLRGDRQKARRTLLAARAKDPDNPYIQNNLNLLDQSLREGAAVR
jgi:Flp pilus assembly protein TadD